MEEFVFDTQLVSKLLSGGPATASPRKGDGTVRGNAKHTKGAAIFAVIVGTLMAVVLSGSAGAQGPTILPAPNVEFAFDAGFSPITLSKTVPTPIALELSGQIKTGDGTHPPALREFILDADKNSAINVRGIPVCRPTIEIPLMEHCPSAIVGRGTMDVEIAFPEQPPLPTKSALTVFNRGVKQGVTTLLMYAFLKNPVSAAVVTTVKIRKVHKGRFGTEAVFSLPVIAGGNGSVTAFDAKLYKRFSYKGKRASLLTLKCPDGKIRARAEAIFSDGAQADAEVLRPCIAKG
jgi:hypothetical protein